LVPGAPIWLAPIPTILLTFFNFFFSILLSMTV
jgi:hypothetical protein